MNAEMKNKINAFHSRIFHGISLGYKTLEEIVKGKEKIKGAFVAAERLSNH